MQKTFTKELATRQNIDFYALSGIFPDPDSVLASQGRGISLYRELLTDPHVRACTMSRKAGVLSKKFALTGDDFAQNLISSAFSGLDLNKIISDILDAPLFGFVPVEIVWRISAPLVGEYRAVQGRVPKGMPEADLKGTPSGGMYGGAKFSGENVAESKDMERGNNSNRLNSSVGSLLILPVKAEAKPQEWFCYDSQNRLRLKTSANFYEGELVPDFKFLCPTHNPSYQNPYGEKLLSSVFWPVTFKKGGIKFWVSFAEKYGMPWALGRIPRQTLEDEALRLRDALDNMVQDGVAVFDDSCAVELVESGSKAQSTEVYDSLVRFQNEEISKAILGQTLTTQVGENGSYAAGRVHSDVRDDIVASDVRLVEKTINQLIDWVLVLNYPSLVGSCRFAFCDDDVVKKDLADRDKVLCDAGLGLTREYFMRTYGFAPEDLA